MKTQAIKKRRGLRFFGIEKLSGFLKNYRGPIAVMLLCNGAVSFIDTMIPIYQRYALNNFVGKGTLDGMPVFIALYALTVVFSGALSYFGCTQAMNIEVSVNRDLRTAAFTHLQTLSFSYYNTNSVGYIHSRVMSDTSRIGSLITWTVMDTMAHGTYLVTAVIVMLCVNARLALLTAAMLPLLAIVFSFFEKKLIGLDREIREANSRIVGNFNEGITGAKTVKTLVAENVMTEEFKSDTVHMLKRSVKASRYKGLFASVMHFASSVALAIVLWQGGVIAGSEVGTFSMFMSYAQGMMQSVSWLVDAVSELVTTRVNIERLHKLLTTVPDVTDTPEVIEKYGDSFAPKRENWEKLNGDIEFDDVTFRYPDGDENVLEHFSLRIPFGTNIAIVGETGAGKSTLVNLICRFFEPTEGRVLIDGRDARERSQLWLHSSIGYVLQTPHLFSGTVRENLMYGNPAATDEEIMRALRLVSADEVIARLENGLDTDVGEGGDMLSTGEKQLISFARAVISEPRILILDEATASVDTITEQKIQAAIDRVINGRTSVVIAHRLSTVRNADVILVVKNGKIIEQGRHDELFAARGYYHSLYTRQYEEEATGAAFEA